MPDQYRFKLTNDKLATYRVVSLLIVLANLFLLVISAFNISAPYRYFALAAALLNLLAGGFFWGSKNKAGAGLLTLTFIVNGIVWLFLHKTFAGLLSFLFALLGYYTNREQVIRVDKSGIQYPSFPARVFEWNSLSQVMLKDDILTIDFKDNRLLQFTLSPETTAGIDVQGFNSFCKEQLSFD